MYDFKVPMVLKTFDASTKVETKKKPTMFGILKNGSENEFGNLRVGIY